VEGILNRCERVLVLEEGYPYIEGKIRGLTPRKSPEILGRLTGEITRTGELSPRIVAEALGLGTEEFRPPSKIPVPRPPALCPPSKIPVPRPPALCPGCPHADTCRALKDALADRPGGRVFSDIGCYTLGALPPYEAIDTCVEMGASITMAKGASAAGLRPAVALIGDSTFTHSGMTGLLDCVNEEADITVVIVDNLTVAMTGGQDSSARSRLESICAGLGVEPGHIKVIEPLPARHEQNVAILKEEIDHRGPSVVIARRECVQTLRRRVKRSDERGPQRQAGRGARYVTTRRDGGEPHQAERRGDLLPHRPRGDGRSPPRPGADGGAPSPTVPRPERGLRRSSSTSRTILP